MMDERGNEFYWREGPRHAHDGWWGGPLHLLVLLLFLIALVAAVVWLVRRLAPVAAAQALAPPAAAGAAVLTADPAVAALRMRYARGEVSREDFQHTIADLTGVPEDTATIAATAAPSWPGSTPGEETEPTPG